jgi:hypothetical protein
MGDSLWIERYPALLVSFEVTFDPAVCGMADCSA